MTCFFGVIFLRVVLWGTSPYNLKVVPFLVVLVIVVETVIQVQKRSRKSVNNSG
jgi:hypothetical protein